MHLDALFSRIPINECLQKIQIRYGTNIFISFCGTVYIPTRNMNKLDLCHLKKIFR